MQNYLDAKVSHQSYRTKFDPKVGYTELDTRKVSHTELDVKVSHTELDTKIGHTDPDAKVGYTELDVKVTYAELDAKVGYRTI